MYKYLNSIQSPLDIKKMNPEELKELSGDIRRFLIEKVSKTGGHLASNLGIVEITLALHYCFNTPDDKFVWDVGHQSYVHKMITGRKEDFDCLRQYEGLSGFPKRCESDHDAFDVGHSSTSISAALGMAVARDLDKKENSVVAIIGDGALTGGMAFEALNHLGHVKSDMIVVLNDNAMSISKNVGSISNYLYKMRTHKMYSTLKGEVQGIIKSIPKIGGSVYKTAIRVRDGVKYFMLPGIFFEEMGIKYFGPVDGHDIDELIRIFESVKSIKGPVLIHAITKKGKGYTHAEKHPDKYHGVGCFDIEKGVQPSSARTYSDVAGEKLLKMASEDNRIVAVTAAMPDGTGMRKFKDELPRRFFDVGIAEGHAVTFCAGMASQGYKPFFPVYSTFLQRGFDQIIHDVAMQKLPVTFLLDRAGIVGNDGETHHGVFDLSYLGLMPNIVVMAPMDGTELEQMLEYSMTLDMPVAIRYPRGNAAASEINRSELCLGRWDVIKQGEEIAMVGIGKGVEIALEASKLLEMEGVKPAVINARFQSHMDIEFIRSIAGNYKHIFTIEDNVLSGGFGSKLKCMLSDSIPELRITNIALPDKFIEHGNTEILLQKYGLDARSVSERISGSLTGFQAGKES
ncbi:1-deoxy-D-xylulose-5-phosphate synthase Dxs [Peptoclostridium acidaminophilum DSM 3953]|uniref:1-deoxy-D-xylulose-5-phosphate synthase n=1 Tax=Peptoclostridium acidaminophilum DSM 3953 TaxID=1286171 RepID=W8T410_PEPAC|nr:1-deoxy-D-xylulose-5-phosphate synthase [Peptoclostridium acidaminophilum]AHM56499.1 1-deoxy-D-xylulose-5-phosphate synthase Dxs [Peptoclostridium acidaminophilum DSM 3953]